MKAGGETNAIASLPLAIVLCITLAIDSHDYQVGLRALDWTELTIGRISQASPSTTHLSLRPALLLASS